MRTSDRRSRSRRRGYIEGSRPLRPVSPGWPPRRLWSPRRRSSSSSIARSFPGHSLVPGARESARLRPSRPPGLSSLCWSCRPTVGTGAPDMAVGSHGGGMPSPRFPLSPTTFASASGRIRWSSTTAPRWPRRTSVSLFPAFGLGPFLPGPVGRWFVDPPWASLGSAFLRFSLLAQASSPSRQRRWRSTGCTFLWPRWSPFWS